MEGRTAVGEPRMGGVADRMEIAVGEERAALLLISWWRWKSEEVAFLIGGSCEAAS